jgi:hypothetical protein
LSYLTEQGAGTAYPPGTYDFIPGFSKVHVVQFLVCRVLFVDHCLCFCPFSSSHCTVKLSIQVFWFLLSRLPISPVTSLNFRFRSSDFSCHVFKLSIQVFWFLLSRLQTFINETPVNIKSQKLGNVVINKILVGLMTGQG